MLKQQQQYFTLNFSDTHYILSTTYNMGTFINDIEPFSLILEITHQKLLHFIFESFSDLPAYLK